MQHVDWQYASSKPHLTTSQLHHHQIFVSHYLTLYAAITLPQSLTRITQLQLRSTVLLAPTRAYFPVCGLTLAVMQVVSFQTEQAALPEPIHPEAAVMQSRNAGMRIPQLLLLQVLCILCDSESLNGHQGLMPSCVTAQLACVSCGKLVRG